MAYIESLLANKFVVLGIFAFVFIASFLLNVFLEKQRKGKKNQHIMEYQQTGNGWDGAKEEMNFYVLLKPWDSISAVILESDYNFIKQLESELKFGLNFQYKESQLELIMLDIEEYLRLKNIEFEDEYFHIEPAIT